MKKNNTIFNLMIFATLFAIIFACMISCISPTTIVFAEEPLASETASTSETDNKPHDLLFYFDISQEDYVFTADDFIDDYVPSSATSVSEKYFAIYTNRTVTFSLKNTDTETRQTSLNDVTINGVQQHGFTSKTLFSFQPNESTDKETRIFITVQHKTTSKNGISYTYQNFSFCIIQTPTNFNKKSSDLNFIKWTYSFNNTIYNLVSPEQNQIYKTLLLTFPSGTELNPIYVEFIFNGEHYLIYKYYDSKSGRDVVKNAIDDSEISNLNQLIFSNSGKYKVMIYDKTGNSKCPDKNYVEYSFDIQNTNSSTSGFYIFTHSQDGTNLMNGQFTNEDVIVDFVNFQAIKSKISKITVIRAYQPTISENISKDTTYLPNELPSSLTFTEDGTYYIKFENRQGDTIASYEFIITKSIKNSFRIDGKDYYVSETEASNKTKEFNILNTISSSYEFKGVTSDGNNITTNPASETITIDGKTENEFDLLVARSEPNIAGIANNQRTKENVHINVYGVGKIDVFVTMNGTQMMIPTEYVNGGRLPTFTEQGKYFIRITDEMGSTVTKSFSITMKLNTASVILIVLACVVTFGLIVFFIISRGKVKVR